jgi:hypothetical protein
MSFRILNFRAIRLKFVELCIVEKSVFSTILVGFSYFSVVAEPGWSLSREIGYEKLVA